LFDTAEIILGAAMVDAKTQAGQTGPWIAPPTVGSFTWRHRHANDPIEIRLLKQVDTEGDQ
jgi:hypothetical protein